MFLGRTDASSEDPQGRLPLETASADDLLQIFKAKGLDTRDFVALSGSHTVSLLSILRLPDLRWRTMHMYCMALVMMA